MRKFFRKARALLLVYYAYMLEYRAELLLWVLSGFGLWTKEKLLRGCKTRSYYN